MRGETILKDTYDYDFMTNFSRQKRVVNAGHRFVSVDKSKGVFSQDLKSSSSMNFVKQNAKMIKENQKNQQRSKNLYASLTEE